MLTSETIRPGDLTLRDRSAWLAIRAAHPPLQSPLLGPDFAIAVGRVRSDAAVAVFRRDGAAVGFLAHHRRPGGLARPIGAPFSDYHALVAGPDLSAEHALRLAGIREYRFTGLVNEPAVSRDCAKADSYAVELGTEPDAGGAYLEALRAGSAKRFKNLRRLSHKLEREIGPPRLIAPDRANDNFDLLFRWKHEQFARSGLTDVFAAPWAGALMRTLFENGERDLSGLMITLMAGDRPAAIHFGIREGHRYHPWAAAHDEALNVYSPGQLFLWSTIRAMPSLGLHWYDLAGGHDHYKLPFANRTVQTLEGRIGNARDGWGLMERALGPRAARLRRRVDQIAAVELTLPGRVGALAHAVAMSRRREATRAPDQEG